MVVEADRRNGVLIEGAISDGLHQGGLPCILQTNDSHLEFFAEESTLDPVQDLIEEA